MNPRRWLLARSSAHGMSCPMATSHHPHIVVNHAHEAALTLSLHIGSLQTLALLVMLYYRATSDGLWPARQASVQPSS
jgi:hypothetical protein